MIMTTYAMTASSQLKSANAVTDIKYHSGKENREKYAHENKDIDQSRSKLNEEFDIYSREELLELHYGELVRKHDRNNNSAKRRYGSVEGYLQKFEGTKVRGLENNERWSTVCQVTYVGDKTTINELLNDLVKAGATPNEVREAYSRGYGAYIARHNEAFPMLPIYHSDIHFDETTPHGHDAIVVMGHTEKGKPTDSLNTALGEKYGYNVHNKQRVAMYREENDQLAFDNVLGALQELGASYGMDFDVRLVRTGQTYSLDMNGYKAMKEELEEAVSERESELDVREKALSGRRYRLDKDVKKVEEREAAVAVIEADLTGREARLKEQEAELATREALLTKKEKEQQEYESNRHKMLVSEFEDGVRFGVETLRELVAVHGKSTAYFEASIEKLLRASRVPLFVKDEQGVLKERTNRERYVIASDEMLREGVKSSKTTGAPKVATPKKERDLEL